MVARPLHIAKWITSLLLILLLPLQAYGVIEGRRPLSAIPEGQVYRPSHHQTSTTKNDLRPSAPSPETALGKHLRQDKLLPLCQKPHLVTHTEAVTPAKKAPVQGTSIRKPSSSLHSGNPSAFIRQSAFTHIAKITLSLSTEGTDSRCVFHFSNNVHMQRWKGIYNQLQCIYYFQRCMVALIEPGVPPLEIHTQHSLKGIQIEGFPYIQPDYYTVTPNRLLPPVNKLPDITCSEQEQSINLPNTQHEIVNILLNKLAAIETLLNTFAPQEGTSSSELTERFTLLFFFQLEWCADLVALDQKTGCLRKPDPTQKRALQAIDSQLLALSIPTLFLAPPQVKDLSLLFNTLARKFRIKQYTQFVIIDSSPSPCEHQLKEKITVFIQDLYNQKKPLLSLFQQLHKHKLYPSHFL